MPRQRRGIRGDVGIAPYEIARRTEVKRWAFLGAAFVYFAQMCLAFRGKCRYNCRENGRLFIRRTHFRSITTTVWLLYASPFFSPGEAGQPKKTANRIITQGVMMRYPHNDVRRTRPVMIEKSGSIRLKDISVSSRMTPEEQELAAGMVRVTHLYRSALKVAVTQMEILDEEFARLYDHSPIHHIEYRIKTLDSIIDKLHRRGLEVTIDNIYAHIQDVAGIRVICNYLDDIYYLRSLLTRSESYTVLREVDYIKQPKDTGYRSLHLIVNVPIVISEGTMVLPVEIQLRTIAMDMWASLEHELRYKSDRRFTDEDAARLRLCSDAISEIDREMQDIYQGNEPQYHA